jgi:hypothetical protein
MDPAEIGPKQIEGRVDSYWNIEIDPPLSGTLNGFTIITVQY